ncbi:sulfite exporter TauE/SafE family protein [Staphylospora marina]|uniref:sulfite exporter TauE/SafE family protein n=1 Tax=Staphylospora marina TaxID=2490858 RepID=UPI000F5BE929|nr:sulfite exporter TauE/SafE family protein [Staphylospora marina]
MLILLLIGLLAGTVGSLVGLGGGIIIVPSLLFLASADPERFGGITPAVAVGTSMLLIILTALSSTLSYARQKRVDFRGGFTFFLASGPGAFVGALLPRYLQSDEFLALFGVLMIIVSWMLRLSERGKRRSIRWHVVRTVTDEEGRETEYGWHLGIALPVSFAVGVISGLFGIGGGSLMVPMMILLFRFPPHMATATSMFIIFLSAVTGSVSHLIQGNVHVWSALFLAPGAWLGGRIGAWISSRLSGGQLVKVLRVALLLMAVHLILDGLGVW